MQTPTRRPLGISGQIDDAATLRTLNRFAVDLIAIPSAEDLFWYVAQHVVGQLNFVDCVIYQANDAQTELRQVAAWGDKNPFGRNIINPLIIPFGRGITGQVAQTREPVIVRDLLKDLNYIPDTRIARSEICVPLVFRGRVVGVIDSEHPEPEAFGEAELEVLTTVAAMTSAKLQLLAEAQRSAQRYQDLLASHAQLTQEINTRKALEARLFEARKLEAIGRLSGRFAHEFNNLLTVVLGNLELATADPDSPETAGYLGEAQGAAQRGARLMQDMLVFAQRTRLSPETLDLAAFVTEFCASRNRGMTASLRAHLPPDLWQIRADRAGLTTALRNLVENAADAMRTATGDGPRSGAVIQIRAANMTQGLTRRTMADVDLQPGRYVRLSVIDTGTGIPDDQIPQIFDPFFTTKPVGSGTGLGLSIVQGFAQQSGGTVTVASEEGLGSTFTLYLPVPDAPDVSRAATGSDQETDSHGK